MTKALLIPVGEMPRTIEVNGLKDLQAAVGGNIEPCSWIFDDEPVIYVNEEGKLNGLLPNRAVYATEKDASCVKWDGSKIQEGECLDILFGDFVAIGFDPETGEDRDISYGEFERVMKRFGTHRSIDSGYLEVLKIQLGAAVERA